MATIIDALVITLGLDSKDAERDLQAVRGRMQAGARSIASAIAAPIAAAAASLFSVGAEGWITPESFTGDLVGKLDILVRPHILYRPPATMAVCRRICRG